MALQNFYSVKMYTSAAREGYIEYNLAIKEAVDGDYQFGEYMVSSESVLTNLYKFGSEHLNQTVYINGLSGLRITFGIRPEYANRVYADGSLTIPLNVLDVVFSVYNGNVRTVLNSFPCFPNDFYMREEVNATISPYYHPYLAWDLTNNRMGIIGGAFQYQNLSDSAAGFSVYHYFPAQNDKRAHETGRITRIPISELNRLELIIPVATGNTLSNAFAYIFDNYSTLNNNVDKDDVEDQAPIINSTSPDEESKEGGGNGPHELEGDLIQIDDIPTIASPFMKLYRISTAGLSNLYNYLTSDNFLDNIKKLFASPFDALVSLNAFPVSAPGTNENIITSGIDTGVSALKVSQNIVDVSCGSINMNKYWDDFLDYETRLQLYLPYVGIQDIATDEFMGDVIKVDYRIDLISGGFVAFISNSKGIVHQTTGNMAFHLPLSKQDYSYMYNAFIGGITSAIGRNPMGVIQSLGQEVLGRPTVQMKGSFGGNIGICGNRKPYLIIERPKPSIPADFNKQVGRKSNITATLGSCKGFTQTRKVYLNNVIATDEEKKEIESLLSEGIII